MPPYENSTQYQEIADYTAATPWDSNVAYDAQKLVEKCRPVSDVWRGLDSLVYIFHTRKLLLCLSLDYCKLSRII